MYSIIWYQSCAVPIVAVILVLFAINDLQLCVHVRSNCEHFCVYFCVTHFDRISVSVFLLYPHIHVQNITSATNEKSYKIYLKSDVCV